MDHRSTTTNLIIFSQFVSQKLDQHCQVDVTYTDFAKAFDRIDHKIILEKLLSFGFSEKLLLVLQSFFTLRTQIVQYNGFSSQPYVAGSAFLQGSSVLGPLIFLLYINDLPSVLRCLILLFAEDALFLQDNLSNLHNWCMVNKLRLNIPKCKIISFTRKKNKIIFNYSIDQTPLPRCDSTKDFLDLS